MNLFFKKILLFTTGLFLLNITVYLMFFKTLPYGEYKIDSKILNEYNNFLFADSHGQSIYQTHLDSINTYNFSYGSDSYFDILAKLQYLYRNEIQVDTIYISIDSHSLSPYRYFTNNKLKSIKYSTYYSFEDYHSSNLISFFYLKYLNEYLPLFDTNNSSLLESLLKKTIKSLASSNKKTSTKDENNWALIKNKIEISTNRINQQFPEMGISSELKIALIRIMELCKINETELIGIKFPLTNSYNQVLLSKNIDFKVDTLLINRGFKAIDFQHLFDKNPEYFSDQDHVNHIGSSKFMISLRDTLSEI